jgi:hypothetical protein
VTSYWPFCSNFIRNRISWLPFKEMKEMNSTGPMREVWVVMEQAKRSATLSLKWKMPQTCHAAVNWSSEYFKMRRVASAQSWPKSSDRHAICGLCNVHRDAFASILLMIVGRHWVHRNPFHRFNKLIDQFGAFHRIHANVAWFLLYCTHGRVVFHASDLHMWIFNWSFESLV